MPEFPAACGGDEGHLFFAKLSFLLIPFFFAKLSFLLTNSVQVEKVEHF